MFGDRAKTVKNHVAVNVELTAEEWRRRFEKQRETNHKLKALIERYVCVCVEWSGGVYVCVCVWCVCECCVGGVCLVTCAVGGSMGLYNATYIDLVWL